MPADDTTIRPFQVDSPDADPIDLRRRITATPWPERETVTEIDGLDIPPGNNPNSSPLKNAPRSDHSVKGRPS
jgi:hypothetical protein